MPYRSSHRHMWPVLVLAGVPLVFLAVMAWLVAKAYRNEQRMLDQDLVALAPFDAAETREDAARKAAEVMGCPLPPPAPAAPPEEIQRRISRELQAEVQKNFPTRAFSEGVLTVNRRLTPAQPGNTVTFQIALENRTVTGTYKGRESGEHWVFIRVDQQKYRMADIAEEYHYLFNEGLADQMAKEAIAEFKKDFEARRNMFVTERYKTLASKHFSKAGYLRTGDDWRSTKDLHAERTAGLFQEAERTFAQERKAETARIIERHRLFGFFPVPPTVPIPAASPAPKPK